MSPELPAAADLVVNGGGPAGLAAALAARRRGLEVLVVDRARPPIDKACGEGLMPDGIAALSRLGVELHPDQGVPFRGIRFVGEGVEADAEFARGAGLGIRRNVLHRVLVDHAEAASIRMCWQARVDAIEPTGVRIKQQLVHCRWLIAADSFHSPMARQLRLFPAWTGPLRIGLRRHYRVRPWTDFVEIHWHRQCEAYVTPVGPEEVCVAIIAAAPTGSAAPRLEMTGLVDRFPTLVRRLTGAEPIGQVRGAMSKSTMLSAVTAGRIALVGDASGMVDAITGEGLALAFRQAEVLAEALVASDLVAYEAAHRRIVAQARLMARVLMLMGRSDLFRRQGLQLLAANPETFQRLLAVHLSDLRPAEAAIDLAQLAVRLLRRSCHDLLARIIPLIRA